VVRASSAMVIENHTALAYVAPTGVLRYFHSGQFMERASRLLGKLKFPGDSVSTDELVCAAWSAAVGKKIARHARAERLVRTKLIVGVADAVWKRQLFTMSRII